jgi:hypothetical protein
MNEPLSRRKLLRGMGATVALPMLESMMPLTALAASAKTPPLRMAFLFVPNGVSMEHWTPATEGAGFEIPDVLAPLSNLRGQFSILTGLTQHHAEANGDGPGDHARSAAAWLTGVQPKKTAGADIHNGISVDQVAAKMVGQGNRFASLEIGCESSRQAGDCDSGYSCAYSSSISWRGEATPNAKEVNPRLVFERLFGDGDAQGQMTSWYRRSHYKQSILDFVLEDANQLHAQLGGKDKQKLDEYLTGLREIETRLARMEDASLALSSQGIKSPAGIPVEYAEHIRLMGDMMVLAFQGDVTRVATFMFANEGSNRNYPMVGVPEGHHDVSHHGTDPRKLEAKRLIDRFHVEQLGYILTKMHNIKEVDGTLLDHTMLVYGGGISDGNRHNHDNLPILFAGKANGAFKQGRHVKYVDGTPMTNLFLSMLDRMGAPIDKLGDSTGRLQGLF